MSLRLRLNLLVAVLNLGFLAALTWLQVDSHRSSINEEIVAAHRVTVQMLGTTEQTSRVFGSAPATMVGFLQGLGRIRANEIHLYSADGAIRYTSPATAYKAGRSAPEWFASLMRPPLEATVIGLDGAARIEIVPDASRAILDAWDSMTAVFLLGLGFVAVLHAALLLFLRRLLRPTEADAQRLVVTTQELAENREVTRLIQDGIEAERKRLARELHDELGQSVTAIRLIATSLARSKDHQSLAQGAEKINEIAAGLYECVHRSVQEALTNVLKHASASRVRLAVTRHDSRLEAIIEDDGRAGAQSFPGSGHGLVGMRERVAALGGSLVSGRRPEGGFRVKIELPLSGNEA